MVHLVWVRRRPRLIIENSQPFQAFQDVINAPPFYSSWNISAYDIAGEGLNPAEDKSERNSKATA